MPYTLAEAAIACGLDKSTVRRAVRAGKISGTKDEAGTWHVEPVELHRVFPPASRTEDDTTAVPLHAPSDAATDILVDELRAIIRASERREEDLRQERDRWRTAFENTQWLLITPGAPGRTRGCRSALARYVLAAALALAALDGVRATMDEIVEHAWIISHRRRFPHPVRCLLDGPCSIARPRASGRDCCRKIGSQRAIEKRAYKTEQ